METLNADLNKKIFLKMCLWMGTWNALFYSSIANWGRGMHCIINLLQTGDLECIVLLISANWRRGMHCIKNLV